MTTELGVRPIETHQGSLTSKKIGRLMATLIASQGRHFNNSNRDRVLGETITSFRNMYAGQMMSDGPGAAMNQVCLTEAAQGFVSRIHSFTESTRVWQPDTFHANTRKFLLENNLLV